MKFFLRNILDIAQDLFCLLNSKQVEDYWHSNCHLAAGDKPQYEVLVLPDHADRQPVQPDEVAALLQEEVQLRRAGRQLVQLPLREGFKNSSSIDKWIRPLIFTPPTH